MASIDCRMASIRFRLTILRPSGGSIPLLDGDNIMPIRDLSSNDFMSNKRFCVTIYSKGYPIKMYGKRNKIYW